MRPVSNLRVELVIPRSIWANSKIAEDWNASTTHGQSRMYPFPSSFDKENKMTTQEALKYHQSQMVYHERAYHEAKRLLDPF